MSLRKTRQVAQVVSVVIFAWVFFACLPTPEYDFVNGPRYLRLNPLVGLLTSVASRHIVTEVLFPALLILAATLVFGRFFCGIICPLGAMIDFWDRFAGARMRNVSRRPPLFLRRLKYVLLAGVFVMALAGSFLPLIADPIALTTRISTLIIDPIILTIGHESRLGLNAAAKAAGMAQQLEVPRGRLYLGLLPAAALLGIILAGTFWDRRFWCQYVCPSGAFFGLLSRYAPFRRIVTPTKCNSCGICASADCPTRAISADDVTATQLEECLVCGACTGKAKQCSSFGFAGLTIVKATPAPDLHRRHAFAGIAAGLVLLPFLRADGASKTAGGKVIRPPGVQPEDKLLTRCTTCGACMKACPHNAIQPCTLSDGVHRLNTPKIVPRIGSCEPGCVRCGEVCPTQAIRKITVEEKPFVKMGSATVERERCRAWQGWSYSLMCVHNCPYDAIKVDVMELADGRRVMGPMVDESLCVGCGVCERICPTWNKAAILVYDFGEHRPAKLPHVYAEQKQAMIDGRRKVRAFKTEVLPGLVEEMNKRVNEGRNG